MKKEETKKMHLFEVVLTDAASVVKKTAKTSSRSQAHRIAAAWTEKHPGCRAVVLGSLYTVYEVLP
jgi:hypothetical protein